MDRWVWERRSVDLPVATSTMSAEGLHLVTVGQPVDGGLRETQAAIAEALRLPSPAERNLDAFADTLRDLRERWDGRAVALVWEGAGLLRLTERRAYQLLTAILDEARVPTIAVVDEEPEDEV